jgi:hypothetical protein
MAQDFWRNSGFHLLERNGAGRLRVTDDFLRAYLLRPELRPVEASGRGEVALYERLLDEPRRAVAAGELDAVEDADARENLQVWLDFRARLLGTDSLEACYRTLFDADVRTPPLFIDQLVQIILRGVLDGIDDPLEARAAEILYREQKVSIDEGRILLADLETVEMHASGGAYGSLGRLIVEAQTAVKAVNLDVLDTGNGALYWQRDQRHDLVIGLNYGREGIAALGRVLARWVRHFTGVEPAVTPLRQIQDERWAWHVGLDGEATAILNDLYDGRAVDEERLRRILSLFRLEFREPTVMLPRIAGRPVYLAMAVDEDGSLRLKPQNLLVNLPLAGQG